MSAPASPNSGMEAVVPPAAAAAEEMPTTAALDVSCRWPVLIFFTKSVGWLVIGLVLALIASIQLHGPGFLSNTAWLTLGRVRPAAMNALLYGFACQAALGALLWMLCRLGRAPLLNAPVMVIAAGVWNLGVFVGVIGILTGHSTGFTWLEMPRPAAFLLFTAYALVGLWALLTFHSRRQRELYVSQWYLVAALFWFPWIYSAATYLLLVDPVRGVMQTVVNAWYVGNFLGLWLTPVALATLFYLIPKLTRRPLPSRPLAAFGFWTLILFGGWTGLTQFIGGPMPVWMISVSIAANLLLVVPILAVASNWLGTLTGEYRRARRDPVLRFVLFGAGAYLLGASESILLGLRTVNRLTQFTLVPMGLTQWVLFGFVGMSFFGALYYIVPRVTAIQWPSARLVQVHFWCSAVGATVCWLALTVGGLVHGARMNQPGVDFVTVVKSTLPFLGLSTLGLMVLLAGQVALAANLYRLGWRFALTHCRNKCGWLKGLNEAEVNP